MTIKYRDKLYSTEQLINLLFILYVFCIPFSKEFTKIISIIILLLWLFNGQIKNKLHEVYNNKIIMVFFVFILYSYISILWSDQILLSLYYVNRYWYYFIIVIIFTTIEKEMISKLTTTFLIAMFVSEIVTYGIYFDFWTTTYNDKMNLPFPTAFMGHGSYSLFAAFTAMITINKIIVINSDSIYKKIFYLVLFLMTFGNLLISGGRTGVLVFVAVFLIMLIIKFYKSIKYLFLSFILIVSLFFIGYKNISIFKSRIDVAIVDINKIVNHNDLSTSFGTRVGFIQLGWEIFKDNPVFGVGLKDNIELRMQYARENENNAMLHFTKWAVDTHFHNEYIEILTSIGLIGFFLFILFLYNITTIKIQSIEYNNLKLIFIITLVFGVTTSALFHQRETIALFSLFIGILLAQNKFEQSDRKPMVH